ncbi:TPA: hypothetical protein NGT93_004374 [Vibrio parahaemolyticus]|nr:hypothetical protein [Vibrio parahaemolyticus]
MEVKFNGVNICNPTPESLDDLGYGQDQIESIMAMRDKATILTNRQSAYRLESDPLYMEWQYDQTPESEAIWRSKVAEIKARIPLPVES